MKLIFEIGFYVFLYSPSNDKLRHIVKRHRRHHFARLVLRSFIPLGINMYFWESFKSLIRSPFKKKISVMNLLGYFMICQMEMGAECHKLEISINKLAQLAGHLDSLIKNPLG